MRVLVLAGLMALAGVGGAGAAELSCRADRAIACGFAECAADAGEGELPVALRYDPAVGKGELCTYTYCRGFTMLRQPGAPRALPRWSGFTWSERSGSVGPGSEKPVVDFQLSIAEDGGSFLLGSVSDGVLQGWAGACAPASAP